MLITANTVQDLVETRPTPRLVLWETTQACPLACVHCRANAISTPDPDELTTEEGFALIDDLASAPGPRPVIVFTGGDPLSRPDLLDLIAHAAGRGLHVAVSPAVSERVTPATLTALYDAGARAISISLDGLGRNHDSTRRVPGHALRTLEALTMARAVGLRVQVNTTVMRTSVDDLPAVAEAMLARSIHTWQVFFLVPTGRANADLALSAHEHEDVARFLYETTGYGFIVRTVEGPLYRRVADALATGNDAALAPIGELGTRLISELHARLGEPGPRRRPSPHPVRDGDGVIFVSRSGDVYASGFLPVRLGSVRERSLLDIYAADPLLNAIREAALPGRCGQCDWATTCGGSRARAWALTGDPLADDPACALVNA